MRPHELMPTVLAFLERPPIDTLGSVPLPPEVPSVAAAAGGAAHRGGKTTCFGLKMEGIVGLGSFWCCWVSSTVELDCDLLPTGKSQSARCQGKHLHF